MKTNKITLFESEMLSKGCQVFTEAFIDKKFKAIDAKVPLNEVSALYEICRTVTNIQNNVLEEEVKVFSTEGSLENYIVSILESNHVEDIATILDVADEAIKEGIGASFNKLIGGNVTDTTPAATSTASWKDRTKQLYNTGKNYIANNPGKVGAAAGAAGLGYLAYKLWKKRQEQNAKKNK